MAKLAMAIESTLQGGLLLAAGALFGDCPDSPFAVVVSQGAGEPASVGSYAVRLYDARDPEWPLDAFLGGLVRPRDGAVESLEFGDVDDDGEAEAVVAVRSMGSGRHLDAEAFKACRGSLRHVRSTSGLPPGADPVKALKSSPAGMARP